jgi:hypothetical protein
VNGLALEAQAPDRILLSTAALARDIRTIQASKEDLRDHLRALRSLVATLRREVVATLRREVGSFISRQIEIYPSISKCELEKQLDSAFAVKEDGCGELQDGGIGDPRVFVEPWGPNATKRVFIVTYGWWGFYGKGGSETVLESYVWEKGNQVRHEAGLIPASFSGMITRTQEVCRFFNPDKYWVLVSGTVGGASGRALTGSAALYEVGTEEIKTLWSAPPGIGNVRAYALVPSQRWEIEYVDLKRFYDNLPNASLLDIYQIDYAKQTFRLLVHRPLD